MSEKITTILSADELVRLYQVPKIKKVLDRQFRGETAFIFLPGDAVYIFWDRASIEQFSLFNDEHRRTYLALFKKFRRDPDEITGVAMLWRPWINWIIEKQHLANPGSWMDLSKQG